MTTRARAIAAAVVSLLVASGVLFTVFGRTSAPSSGQATVAASAIPTLSADERARILAASSSTPSQTLIPTVTATPDIRPQMPAFDVTLGSVTPLSGVVSPLPYTVGFLIERGGVGRVAPVPFNWSRFAVFGSAGDGPSLWELDGSDLVERDAAGLVFAREPGANGFVQESRDGKTRLFFRRVEPSGAVASELRTSEGGRRTFPDSSFGASLSPSGRWVAWTQVVTDDSKRATANQLVLSDVTTDEERRIDFPPRFGGGDAFQIWYDYFPVWSPSGRFLRIPATARDGEAFRRSTAVVDALTGDVQQFVVGQCDSGPIFIPQWALDSDRLMVPDGCDESGQRRVALFDAATGMRVRLPQGESYAFGVGGVLVGRGGGVERIDSSGALVQRFEVGNVANLGVPFGLQLVAGPQGAVFVSTPRGAYPSSSGTETFSGDRRCDGTAVYSSDASSPRCLAPREGLHPDAVALSRDGSMLAIVESVSTRGSRSPYDSQVVVRLIDLLTHKEISALSVTYSPDYAMFYVPVWSTDGSRVLVYGYTTAV